MNTRWLVVLALCGILGCSKGTDWRPPLDGGHHVSGDGASIFAFEYRGVPDRSLVLYFPFEINSKSTHNANPTTKTFNYSGEISAKDTARKVSYSISSSDANVLTINGGPYDLDQGTVFVIGSEMAPVQLPFISLTPSTEYLQALKTYFSANEQVRSSL